MTNEDKPRATGRFTSQLDLEKKTITFTEKEEHLTAKDFTLMPDEETPPAQPSEEYMTSQPNRPNEEDTPAQPDLSWISCDSYELPTQSKSPAKSSSSLYTLSYKILYSGTLMRFSLISTALLYPMVKHITGFNPYLNWLTLPIVIGIFLSLPIYKPEHSTKSRDLNIFFYSFNVCLFGLQTIFHQHSFVISLSAMILAVITWDMMRSDKVIFGFNSGCVIENSSIAIPILAAYLLLFNITISLLLTGEFLLHSLAFFI